MKYILYGIAVLILLCSTLWVIGGNKKYNTSTEYIFYDTNNWHTIERILADNGVGDIEDCLVWAFGEEYKLLKLRDLDDVWTQRHSDSFTIKGSDCIIESTKKIAKVYLWYNN